MRRLAVISLHTSPLSQPGTGDGGGMNVYVRELSAALARPGVVEEFADGVLKRMGTSDGFGTDEDLPFDAVHANYWLSGMAGHLIKHQMNLPLVSTFHTLDRVKAEASPEEVEADSPHQRAEAEATVI